MWELQEKGAVAFVPEEKKFLTPLCPIWIGEATSPTGSA